MLLDHLFLSLVIVSRWESLDETHSKDDSEPQTGEGITV